MRWVNIHEFARGAFTSYTSLRVDPEISGGVVFQLRPHLGVLFDAKQLIGNNSLRSDPGFKASIGLHWRF